MSVNAAADRNGPATTARPPRVRPSHLRERRVQDPELVALHEAHGLLARRLRGFERRRQLRGHMRVREARRAQRRSVSPRPPPATLITGSTQHPYSTSLQPAATTMPPSASSAPAAKRMGCSAS